MMILFLIMVKILESSGEEECYYDGNDFCVNPDDILSFDLLPGSLLLDISGRNTSGKTMDNNSTVNGTFEEALNKMDYHRKRMNEYLCHGFMAEEIFREVKTTRVKRLQDPSMNSISDFLGEENITVHDKLLSDEGSSKYKDWLQRTTTLDDIYRHYMPNKLQKKIGKKGIPHNFEQFDGEVTGYAVPAPIGPMAPSKIGSYYDDGEEVSSSQNGRHQYSHPPSGPPHQSHMPPGEIIPIINEEHYYQEVEDDDSWQEVSSKGKGELTIKDFFEIALTALAFLAFGLFIIQLLMAITNSTTTAAVVSDESIRFKRNTFSSKFSYNSNAELNELAHRVLRSIEAAMIAEYDAGRCLRWTLCQDNQHSRIMRTGQRIWLPVWSVGMSWLCGHMVQRATWPAMFDSIKASILGLGGANCHQLYPGCNLAEERKRRRRRRK